MAQLTASSWIILMILLNHGIITVISFDFSLDGLFDYGLNLLIDHFYYEEEEEIEEITMDDVIQRINVLENTIKASEKTIITELGHIVRHESVMRDYTRDVSYILKLYEQFQEYSKDYELFTLQKFAEISLTEGDDGLTDKLNNLVDLISPRVPGRTPLLELTVELYNNSEIVAEHCGRTISVQQEIYNMFGEIALYLIRGYAVKFNAYKILRKNGHGKFIHEKKLTRSSYKEAMRKVIRAAIEAMRISPKDIRSCDPPRHREGKTYIQLKWLFNGIMMEEQFMKGRETACDQTCEDHKKPKIWNLWESSEWMRCSGQLYDCHYLRNHQWFCPGTKDGIRYDAAGPYATASENCENPLNSFEQLKRSGPSNAWSSNSCDLCSCACDDTNHPNSVRRFNLSPVQSDSEKNQVIAGLRFVEKDRVIYIQIQTGKLKPHGNIDASPIQWQPINKSQGNDWVVTYSQKSVNLDTLEFLPGQVLTGIKFNVRDHRLELNLMAHSFDYSTGVLHDANDDWISSGKTHRKEIKIEKADIPTDAHGANIVNLEKNKYVNFRMTDWEVDLSQTAVPFIDAQPVISNPPRPLSGAGIYYRGQQGYGGFIGLKLLAYDYGAVLAQAATSRPGKKQREEETGSTEVESSEESKEDKAAPGVKAEYEKPELEDVKELAEKFKRRKLEADRKRPQRNRQGRRQRNGSGGGSNDFSPRKRNKHRRGG